MEKAGDVLKRFFSTYSFPGNENYSSFFNGWEAIVGKKLGGHSRILDIQDRILIVEVDHPGVLQMFSLQRKKFLTKITKKYPELDIQNIKLRLKFKGDEKKTEVRKEKNQYVKAFAEPDRKNNEDTNSEDLEKLLNKLYNSVLSKQMRVDKNS